MIKVVATGESKRLNKGFIELHRCAEEGEVFEISEERFEMLNGKNKFNAVFVEKYVEPKKKTTRKKSPKKPEVK